MPKMRHRPLLLSLGYIGGTEVFLPEQWGSATKANVDVHVAWLRTHGDSYDKQNLPSLIIPPNVYILLNFKS